ncbi:hypothetical protein OF117_14990 [Geodermatophilus sp. YIM 151500]|uniref:hypothetical protein n=1 Tax=Geodermatophilus sp. YIM 151500 TaxID=2984531 RepID=UPI0021E4415C|nr:hypothetical protein [Geodermatophilus sp. YIM 151500]MCV2490666.1 hypothetical protein [Geodermatophilus sp. YIM 151500]
MNALSDSLRADPLGDVALFRTRRRLLLAVAVTVLLSGSATALLGVAAVGLVAALALFVWVALHPVSAVYIYMATLPFLVGIDRGRLLPLVRPNEALLAFLVAGATCGAYLRFLRGDEVRLRMRPLDIPLGVFVLFSTLWPISWLLLRGTVPSGGDIAALLPVCKLVGLLILVRTTIRTDDQLLRMGRLVIWPAAVIGLIAVLQTLRVPPVVTVLGTYWVEAGRDPSEVSARGSTTLASSIATGDYVILSLALLMGLAVRRTVGRREALLAGLPLGAGALATGQFSTWASAAVVTSGMLFLYPQLRRLGVRILPIAVVGALLGMPAFIIRLREFGGGLGVPSSWLGRWDNLTNFYLPALGSFRWVLGVGPNSVLRAPETWREEIFLEYGYLQFLWVGGLPLLAAFGWLSVEVLRYARRCARRADVVGAYGSALWAGWLMVLLLSVIDIHLVLRGAGELFFLFLAVVSGRADEHE